MTSHARQSEPIRIGFLALTDAAPLIVAERRGIFRRRGLDVRLSREVGWATIRDKIVLGELEAAQAPAPMLWAIQLGIGCAPCNVLTAYILNLNGNAVTLARSVPPEDLKAKRRLTLGVVFRFSSHLLLLRDWLRGQRIDPDADARIVVLPPAQMVRNLEAGTIDGYAAGEPWNTLAVQRGLGWCPAWSAADRPDQMEKVLLVTQAFAEARAEEHARLLASVSEAGAWAETPENREELAQILADEAYLNVPAKAIAPTLLGRFDTGRGEESVPHFHVFHGPEVNVPTPEKGMEMQTRLAAARLIPRETAMSKSLFRKDVYTAALSHERIRSVT